MRTIPGYPNYKITKNGKVWSKVRKDSRGHLRGKKWLKPIVRPSGHLIVNLYHNNKYKQCYIHRLVLETYIGPCPKGKECRHLDGNPTNNNLNNLCWGTSGENANDCTKHGGRNPAAGERNGQAKLTKQDVRTIIYMWQTKEFTRKEIANLYNITVGNILCIVNRKTWKHIWKDAT